MQQIFPQPRTIDDPLAIYDELRFPDAPADRPYLYLNMVSSVDGRAQFEGRASGLGSRVDRQMMLHLRALADAVLQGAGTVRVEKVYRPLPEPLRERRAARGQPAEPRWIVVSGSGDVPPAASILTVAEPRPVLLTTSRAPADRLAALALRSDVVALGHESVDLVAGMRLVRQRYGVTVLLSEGGPTMCYALLSRGLVDELFVTLGAKIVGGDALAIVHGPAWARDRWPTLELISAFEHEGELYLRYRVRYPAGV